MIDPNKLMTDSINGIIQHSKKTIPDFNEGVISDGYHTFDELYEYRRAYNTLLFNTWSDLGIYNVQKSKRHSDGETCFGKDTHFIVVAETPAGQISNHYKMEYWDDFRCKAMDIPNIEYDGHSPKDALDRMHMIAGLDIKRRFKIFISLSRLEGYVSRINNWEGGELDLRNINLMSSDTDEDVMLFDPKNRDDVAKSIAIVNAVSEYNSIINALSIPLKLELKSI